MDCAARHGEARIRGRDVMECTVVGAGHSGLMPADLTTLPHLSVSFATIFPNVSGDPPVPVTPSSASRVLTLEACRIALISLC